MKGSFEFMDHTADVSVVAWGEDLREAFAQAALGLFALVVEIEGVREEEVRAIEVTAPDREALLVAWLKLRRRDLSAILEGSDWGINARMRLTHSQALEFTHRPDFPPGSRGVVRRAWMWWLVPLAMAAAVAVWYSLGAWAQGSG